MAGAGKTNCEKERLGPFVISSQLCAKVVQAGGERSRSRIASVPNTTMPQGDHKKRSPPASIPDGLNGRALVWTRDQFTLREFLDIYSYRLPKMVSVQNGYMGKDDLHTFATDEVYWMSAVKTQRRIVAREEGGYYVSIPVDYPLDVTIYPKDGKEHLASLSEVATMRSQCRDEFCIIFENDRSVEFSMGADSGTKANLGILTVTDVYDEHYFIGYPLAQGQVSLSYMVTIPAYVTISLVVATGIQREEKDVFVTMMDNMKTAIDSIVTNYKINHEIILFPKNITSNEYEYIDPANIMRSTPVRKPTASTKAPSKGNPYVSLSKTSNKKGAKPPSPAPVAPVAASVPGKPVMPSKPPVLSSATVRGHAAMLGQATKRGQGRTAVQGQESVYRQADVPNQAATLSQANPSYQANPVHKAPPSCQAVFTAAGSEVAREATKRRTRPTDQTPPTKPLVGYSTLNRRPSHTDIKDMSVDEITDWMRRMNMGQYTDVIVTNGIDGALLESLDEDILTREFGFTRFHAIKLLKFANQGYRPT